MTAKQRLFVAYYLGVSAGNATDAARRACYSSPAKQAPQLLAIPSIRAAIDAKLNEASLSANQILARLSEIAEGGIADFIEVDGPIARFDFAKAKRRGKLSLLKKYKVDDKGVQIETHDPMKALELLGKYRAMWTDKNETDITTKNESINPDPPSSEYLAQTLAILDRHRATNPEDLGGPPSAGSLEPPRSNTETDGFPGE